MLHVTSNKQQEGSGPAPEACNLKPMAESGFSLVELLLVIGLTVILGGIIIAGLTQTRSEKELESARVEIVALLREAQSRSVIQASNTTWGVHFENATTTTPFFALFHTSYSTTTAVRRESLPQGVAYATSTLAAGNVAEVTFSQLSGRASGSSTIGIYNTDNPSSSTTITISSEGSVSF